MLCKGPEYKGFSVSRMIVLAVFCYNELLLLSLINSVIPRMCYLS